MRNAARPPGGLGADAGRIVLSGLVRPNSGGDKPLPYDGSVAMIEIRMGESWACRGVVLDRPLACGESPACGFALRATPSQVASVSAVTGLPGRSSRPTTGVWGKSGFARGYAGTGFVLAPRSRGKNGLPGRSSRPLLAGTGSPASPLATP